jgi:hypothetical protein
MIVKKTKQLGNFKKGINLYVPKKRIVSAAPSGIPVASTNDIIISNIPDAYGNANSGGSVTCGKYNTSNYHNPSFNNGFEGTMSIDFSNNQWVLYLTYFDQGEFYSSFPSYSAGISSIIPIVGWSPIAITITAA